MNQFMINTLKVLRKTYIKVFDVPPPPKPNCEQDPEVVSSIIYKKLMDTKPCMIARFGANELSTLINYIGIRNQNKNVFDLIQGKSLPWWWNENHIKGNMYYVAGFFPPTTEKIEQFCKLMLEDICEVDVLGSWLADEKYLENSMNDVKVHLRLLEPFWDNNPWTKALRGKKVLIVHPFAETIISQYNRRNDLFEIKETLPEFKSLAIIKAIQTHGEASNEYKDWFEALNFMKNQIDQSDYEVCLIGAGAYGFSLAAHVKRMGKKAIHLGGALQLLFGIKGKRWEDPNFGVQEWGIPYGSYLNLMNEYWVRPLKIEKPAKANAVEGACYW